MVSAQCGYSGAGDWIINQSLVCENESITIASTHDMIINSTNVRFNNVTIDTAGNYNSDLLIYPSDVVTFYNTYLDRFDDIHTYTPLDFENTTFDTTDSPVIIHNSTHHFRNVTIITSRTGFFTNYNKPLLEIQASENSVFTNLHMIDNNTIGAQQLGVFNPGVFRPLQFGTTTGTNFKVPCAAPTPYAANNITFIDSDITGNSFLVTIHNFNNMVINNISMQDAKVKKYHNALFKIAGATENISISNVSYTGCSLQSFMNIKKYNSTNYPKNIFVQDACYAGGGRFGATSADEASGCMYGDSPTTVEIWNSTIICVNQQKINWTDGRVNLWNTTFETTLGYGNGELNHSFYLDTLLKSTSGNFSNFPMTIDNIYSHRYYDGLSGPNGRNQFMLPHLFASNGTVNYNGLYLVTADNTTHKGDNSTFLDESKFLEIGIHPYNDVPNITRVTIWPNENVSTESDLICAPWVSDANDNQVSLNWTWFKNGAHQPQFDLIENNVSSINGNLLSGERAISLIPRLETSLNDEWECKVQAYDGKNYSGVVNASINVTHIALPYNYSINCVMIIPKSPFVSDELSCVAHITDAIDVRNESTNLTFNWYKNGVHQPQFTGYHINVTSKGIAQTNLSVTGLSPSDEWICEVWGYNGFETTLKKNSSSEVVANNLPILNQPHILPDTNVTNSANLNCVVSFHESDNELGNISFRWYKNDIHQAAYDSVSYNIPSGNLSFAAVIPNTELFISDTWKCEARVYDSHNYSSWQNSSIITVQSAQGFEITGSVIFPQTPLIDDNLTCVATAAEPNNLSMNMTFKWYKNNIHQAGYDYVSEAHNGDIIESTKVIDLVKDDVWVCEVQAYNGFNYTDKVNSSGVIVINRVPIIYAEILPKVNVTERESIQCFASFSDVDSNFGNITFKWYKNGIYQTTSVANDIAEGSIGFSSIISDLKPFDTWTCEAYVYDGYDNSLKVNSSDVTIKAEPSHISGVLIFPSVPLVSDNMTCFASVHDPMDRESNITFAWYKNGIYQFTGYDFGVTGLGQSNLTVTNLAPLDEWVCEAQAYNGQNYTAKVNSSSVTVTPSTLIMADVFFYPPVPVLGTNMTCFASFEGDLDANITYWIYREGTINLTGHSLNISPGHVSYSDATFIFDELNIEWICEAQACHAFGCSLKTNSTPLVKNNTPANLTLFLTPELAYGTAPLNLSVFYLDIDGLPGALNIFWKRDGAHIPLYDYSGIIMNGDTIYSVIPREVLSVGQTWEVFASVFDGYDYTNDSRSITVQFIPSPVVNGGGSGGGGSATYKITFSDKIPRTTEVSIITSTGLSILSGTVEELDGFKLSYGNYVAIIDGESVNFMLDKHTMIELSSINKNELNQGFDIFRKIRDILDFITQWINQKIVLRF